MINKYQQGGAAASQEEQLVLMGMQIIQAAQQGDLKATQIVQAAQQVAQDLNQIQLVMQAALQGDLSALAVVAVLAAAGAQLQGGQQAVAQPTMARNGAKLNYIKLLRGQCPDGYEMGYYKAGGRVCKKCMKKKANSGKMTPSGNAVDAFKCGRKMKKVACGSKVEKDKCGGKPRLR